MFWGLILKSNKKYSQKLKSNFHLSQATLDRSSAGSEDVQVMIVVDNESFLLCTLNKSDLPQCSLDYNFYEGQEVCFVAKGPGVVHLTGFLIPEEEDMFDMDGEEDEEEEETALTEPAKLSKKKVADAINVKEGKNKGKKGKVVEAEDDDDDEEDDPDYSNGKLVDPELLGEDDDSDEDDDMAGSDDSADDDDDEDDDEDDEEEDDDDDEEEVKPPKAKKAKQNGLENGNKVSPKEKPQQKEKVKDAKGATQKPKTIQGGVVIEDIKVGGGNEVKSGKKVQVWYEGRLKTNNKVFDSTKQGPGFKFVVGGGQVIKAWDVGIIGMKVGGKRRITCPPAMAYGQRGQPPVIPGNATLVFDVELRNVL